MLIIIILEVPVELAELLGENAPGLPEGLAIYLASDGRELKSGRWKGTV